MPPYYNGSLRNTFIDKDYRREIINNYITVFFETSLHKSYYLSILFRGSFKLRVIPPIDMLLSYLNKVSTSYNYSII